MNEKWLLIIKVKLDGWKIQMKKLNSYQ
jgi:hypothetical protein